MAEASWTRYSQPRFPKTVNGKLHKGMKAEHIIEVGDSFLRCLIKSGSSDINRIFKSTKMSIYPSAESALFSLTTKDLIHFDISWPWTGAMTSIVTLNLGRKQLP
ncbi:hypothetical protein N7G274_010422 [Stereocaulon virgatum]|uniref:Uncharacterized protein n=1 Tax=Stereocaulon virgatum TaxID=373712 RepID=A0ABR3ZUQ8_9LECA